MVCQENTCLLYGVCRCIELKVQLAAVSAVLFIIGIIITTVVIHAAPMEKKCLHNPKAISMQFHSYEQSLTS